MGGGQEYWKPVGLLKSRLKGWMSSVSDRAGVNKKTKRITSHSKRQEIKRLLKKNREVL